MARGAVTPAGEQGPDGAGRWADVAATTVVLAVAGSVKIALANGLLLLAAAAFAVARAKGQAEWRSSPLQWAVWAYALASLGAVAFSLDPGHSLSEVGELLTLALVPLVVSLLDRRRWDLLLKALTVVAVLSSAVGLWQYLHGASTLAHRLRGLANHYMTFSGWTLVVVLLLVADIAFAADRRRLRWSVPAVALCALALALSYTRSAWIGLAAGLVLAAAVWRPRAVLALPVVALAVALALPRPVLERAASIVDLHHPSNYDRLCMVMSGLEMVGDHPLFGVGLGMVERRYPVHRQDDAPRWRIPHLHDNPLQIAAERGLMGLGAYLAVLAVFALHTGAALRRRDHPAYSALAGCALAVAGVTVAGLFEYNWGDAEVWIPTLAVLAAPFALAPEER
jgi:O-antigen ligase